MQWRIFLVLQMAWQVCRADYSIRFRVSSSIRKDYSSSIHFLNLDSTTFYDKISMKLSSQIVSLLLAYHR